MNYAERFALVEDGKFKNRLQLAIWIAATNVIAEPAGAANHAARLLWAKKNLRGATDTDDMRRFAIRATASVAVGATGLSATDSEIQAIVDAIVNEFV